MIKSRWVLLAVALAICASVGFVFLRRASGDTWHGRKRLIVLGIDGMDPDLLHKFAQDGKMPNFAWLLQNGSFRKLTTAIPPQSPVAWSNLITGMNPGGHGIFDFIHRDPRSMQPYLSISRVEPPKHNLKLGSWVIPLGSGTAEQLRHGEAFWQILDQHGIPTTVIRMPSNFPPVTSHARTFAGMGTPDLRGTYGTFSFYTDDPLTTTGAVEGGDIIGVQVENGRVSARLPGPDNTFRKSGAPAMVDFIVDVDPVESAARFTVQDNEFVLREGEWSDWVHVNFEMVPGLVSVEGICRFYLKQAHPRFQLYVSPVNIDPANPALPLSTPASFSQELAQEIGPFYTQGIAEDTKALSDGVLDDKEYLEQSRRVLSDYRRIFDKEFPKFHSGVFFFYFSSLDLNSHMFWRTMDEHHPEHTPGSAEYADVIEQFYVQIDQVLGEVLPHLDDHTTLLVLSDHGFAPFYRSFALNTWLLQNGYLQLKQGADPQAGQYFENVDWSRTRAYGLGLNGLYLNLRGREKDGIVQPGHEADALMHEITQKLLAVRDPKNDTQVITRIDRATQAYQGAYVTDAPDMLVGYNRGYRAGWKTVLGAFSTDILEDNTNAWSGDHCMDYTLVPGVLLSNRSIDAQTPALTDIAPTILSEFQIAKPKSMIGASIFHSQSASR